MLLGPRLSSKSAVMAGLLSVRAGIASPAPDHSAADPPIDVPVVRDRPLMAWESGATAEVPAWTFDADNTHAWSKQKYGARWRQAMYRGTSSV